MNTTVKVMLWMGLAITSFSLMAVAGREAAAELDTFEIMFFRSLTSMAIVLTVARATGTLSQISRTHLNLHITRNICHFIGQNLWLFALTMIPLAQVFALEFTTPIWVILLSPLMLSEQLTGRRIITAGLGFVGVLIVAQPDPSHISPGLIAAAVCAIFFAFTAIFTRQLTQNDTMTCIMFYLTLTQACFGFICAGFDGHIALPSWAMLPWVIIIGAAGLCAHFGLTKALSLAPASTVIPIDFARLPTIAIVGAVFYQEPLTWAIFLGAGIIFLANFINLKQS